MSIDCNPPPNRTLWPDLGLALQMVYNTNEGVAERKESVGGYFQVTEKFKECLDTLEACADTKEFPEGYVLRGESFGGIHKNISYVGVHKKIRDFAKIRSRNYDSVFRDLRIATLKILRGIYPAETGRVFEDFAKYIEVCYD